MSYVAAWMSDIRESLREGGRIVLENGIYTLVRPGGSTQTLTQQKLVNAFAQLGSKYPEAFPDEMPTEPEPEWLTVNEVAERWGLKQISVYQKFAKSVERKGKRGSFKYKIDGKIREWLDLRAAKLNGKKPGVAAPAEPDKNPDKSPDNIADKTPDILEDNEPDIPAANVQAEPPPAPAVVTVNGVPLEEWSPQNAETLTPEDLYTPNYQPFGEPDAILGAELAAIGRIAFALDQVDGERRQRRVLRYVLAHFGMKVSDLYT